MPELTRQYKIADVGVDVFERTHLRRELANVRARLVITRDSFLLSSVPHPRAANDAPRARLRHTFWPRLC